MAKPKFDAKKFFMEKGEKVGIIAAGALMLLLIIWGVTTMIGSADTGAVAGDISKSAKGIQQKIASDSSQKPKDLEDWVTKPVKFDTLWAKNYENNAPFIDIVLDNAKRGSPTILMPVEFQVDLVRAPIETYLFQGTKDNMKIAVTYTKEVQKNERIRDLGKKKRDEKDKKKDGGNVPPGGNLPSGLPGGGFPGGGFPGGGFPGGGMASGAMGGSGGRQGGGGQGGGLPQMPAGMAMPGQGGMGMPGMPSGQQPNTPVGPRTETGIEFVPVNKLGQNHKPAEFIQPVRMVVISASFPYRKQLEEYQKALRYQTLNELAANPADMPVFKGFNVERQVKSVDGKILQGWTPFDWQAAYKAVIYEKKVLDNEPEDPKIQDSPVIPPDNQHLCMPLPKLAPGRKYPPLTLNTILDTADKLKKSDTPTSTNSIWGRGKGDADIFDRSGAAAENPEPKDTKDPKESDKDNLLQGLPEYVLVRFVDCTVKVGYVYEYRIAMKVANPNKGKDKLVGRPDYAKFEELVGPPCEVRFNKDGHVVTGLPITLETEVFADPLDTKNYYPSNKDEIKLQLQTWLESIRPQKDNANYVEQVGDWVVTDIKAYRGQFIGGTENVKLPLWSPTAGGYQFKELAKFKTSAKDKGTVGVDFVSYALLVDFEGGRMPQIVYHNRTITDDAGMEILMMTYDGRLIARSAPADEKNATRREREVAWTDWQKETEKAAEKPKEGGTNPFGGSNPKP
ncbi:MAG TPA: hypothetical protein VKS79_01410 [Gemmataceae bacterium]|nr:hypothetical protein [Gemmataceae bacterium]